MNAQPFFLQGDGDTALLFIHGFTATPSEVYPTAVLVHEYAGYTISGILLPGHGSTPEQLDGTSWRDWVAAVEAECCRLTSAYKNVFVAGLSMGGLLSLYIAARIDEIRGVVSINAPVFNRNPFASPWFVSALTPILAMVSPTFPKQDPEDGERLEDMGRQAYRCYPVKALRDFLHLRRLALGGLGAVKVPTLVMQSMLDKTVNSTSGRYLMTRLKHAPVTYVELQESEHIATMGVEKEMIAAAICEFILKAKQDGGGPIYE